MKLVERFDRMIASRWFWVAWMPALAILARLAIFASFPAIGLIYPTTWLMTAVVIGIGIHGFLLSLLVPYGSMLIEHPVAVGTVVLAYYVGYAIAAVYALKKKPRYQAVALFVLLYTLLNTVLSAAAMSYLLITD